MSIAFASASSEDLSLASLVNGTNDFFLNCWFQPTGASLLDRCIFALYDNAGGDYVAVYVTRTGAPPNTAKISTFISSGPTLTTVTNSNGWTNNAWNNLQAYFNSGNEMGIRINGGSWSTGAAGAPTVTHTTIASNETATYYNGQLADFLVTNLERFSATDPTAFDAMADSLVLGYTPLPYLAYIYGDGGSVSYWPMESISHLTDVVSRTTLTANNTPTTGASHPSLIYPRRGRRVIHPAVVTARPRSYGFVFG